jgi:hypothetical protein
LSQSTRYHPLTQDEYVDLMQGNGYPQDLAIDNGTAHLTNEGNHFDYGPHIHVGAVGGNPQYVRVEDGVGPTYSD